MRDGAADEIARLRAENAERDATIERLRKAIETVDCDAIREWCDECDGKEAECICWVKSFSAALAQPKEQT
jgi:hypothetical protein